MIRVLLVTTWDTACGIAEHSWYLKQAVEAADRSIEIDPRAAALHPGGVFAGDYGQFDLLHLNYHAALHSLWQPDVIRRFILEHGTKVVVTYHDTGVPNSDQAKAICAAADAFVVHEPYDDLEGNGRYWRMGVPDWPRGVPDVDRSPTGVFGPRPILGSIGFPFPWKNYDLLASITADLDWGLLLIAPTATAEQVRQWKQVNPHCWVEDKFLPRDWALTRLAICDATAFPYVCANTGQSGAILQGIATRKPVHAFATCRQFRSLFADPLGRYAITWEDDVEALRYNLTHATRIARVHPPMVALAEQDSWRRLGEQYAALYKELV